jgi:hypothetical protein
LKKQPRPAPVVSVHRAALQENLRAITDLRAKLNQIHERDRLAAADVASAEGTAARVRTIQESIDERRGEAAYSNSPPPDVRKEEKLLAEAQLLDRGAQAVARTAAVVRTKFAADIAALGNAIGERGKENPRLLFNALREDCLAGLAQEYLAAEQAYLDVRRRAFGAATAADTIAMEKQYGIFSGSRLGADFNIPRPDHPAYRPIALTPEESYAERDQYAQSIAAAAHRLMNELLGN